MGELLRKPTPLGPGRGKCKTTHWENGRYRHQHPSVFICAVKLSQAGKHGCKKEVKDCLGSCNTLYNYIKPYMWL